MNHGSSRYIEECETQVNFLQPNVELPEEYQGFSYSNNWLEMGLGIAGFVLALLGVMAGAHQYAKKKYPRIPRQPTPNQIYNSSKQPHHQSCPMSHQLEQMHSEPVFQPHHPHPMMHPCQFQANRMMAPRMSPPTPYSVNQSWNKSSGQPQTTAYSPQ